MAVNHPLNAWNFQLAWFFLLKVPSRLGLSSSIGKEENLFFLLHHTKFVLVQTYYLFTLDNQRVLSLWRRRGGKLPPMPLNSSTSIRSGYWQAGTGWIVWFFKFLGTKGCVSFDALIVGHINRDWLLGGMSLH